MSSLNRNLLWMPGGGVQQVMIGSLVLNGKLTPQYSVDSLKHTRSILRVKAGVEEYAAEHYWETMFSGGLPAPERYQQTSEAALMAEEFERILLEDHKMVITPREIMREEVSWHTYDSIKYSICMLQEQHGGDILEWLDEIAVPTHETHMERILA